MKKAFIDSNKPINHNNKNSNSYDLEGNRKLGEEWINWDGRITDNSIIYDSRKSIFLIFAFVVIIMFNLAMYAGYYLVIPRLEEFNVYFPSILLFFLILITIYLLFWYIIILITSYTSIKLSYLDKGNRLLIGFLLDMVFKLGGLIGYSRDKLGNSFIKVSNNFIRSTKKLGLKERILLLLPRCLTKNSYKEIKQISKEFAIEMAVCTGGEVARLKIKKYKPSAVIGVACERDLVSGIRDVSGKIAVLGIPNIRPEGPCRNTYINFDLLRTCIKFYLGQ